MDTLLQISYQINLTPITFCKYQLNIDDKSMLLTFPQVLQLREKIQQLTSHQKLTEIIDNENFVLLLIADMQHLVYLEVEQLLDLQEEIACFFCRF